MIEKFSSGTKNSKQTKLNRKTKSFLVEIDWVVNIFLLFRFYFAFEKNIIIHLKKIEFSLTKNVLL